MNGLKREFGVRHLCDIAKGTYRSPAAAAGLWEPFLDAVFGGKATSRTVRTRLVTVGTKMSQRKRAIEQVISPLLRRFFKVTSEINGWTVETLCHTV